MTGDGNQGGTAGYPDVPYHPGVDTITNEINAVAKELGRKVDQVTNVLQARPEDPRVSNIDERIPQPDADGRGKQDGRIPDRQDGFAYDRQGGESGRQEGTYDRRGESAYGEPEGESRTLNQGTYPHERPREEGSGDERDQFGLENGYETEGEEYGRHDGGHRRADGEHDLSGGSRGQSGGGHGQIGGGHGQLGGELDQPGSGHDQSGNGHGHQGGRQGQQVGRHGQQGGRHGQQGGRHGQQGGEFGQQGGRFGQHGGRFGQHGGGQSGHGQRGRGNEVQGGEYDGQSVSRDGEEHEQGSGSGLPERETSTAQYDKPRASGTVQTNLEGRQDGTENRVGGTHGNQHGIRVRPNETHGRQNGSIGRQDGVHGRQGGIHGRQGGFGERPGGAHGRHGGAGTRVDVATGRFDDRQDHSLGKVGGSYGGRDGLHGSSVGIPGRTGSSGTVSWEAGQGQGNQGFSQSSHSSFDISSSGRDAHGTGFPSGHDVGNAESDLDVQDFESDIELGSDDDDIGSGQGVDQEGLPFGTEDFPVVAEPESNIAVTGVEGFVTATETGTTKANGTGDEYEESEYDYYYEEAEEEEEEEEEDNEESFDDYKYYEDYNVASRRKRRQHNEPGHRLTTLAPDVASTLRDSDRVARPNAISRNASNLESEIGSYKLSRMLSGRQRTTTTTGYVINDIPESNDVIESRGNRDKSTIGLRSTGANGGMTPDPGAALLPGPPGDARPGSRRIIRPGPPLRPGGSGTPHVKRRPQKSTFFSNVTGGGGVGYPRLQTLRKLAKKWRARKQQLQRAKREVGDDLTWI